MIEWAAKYIGIPYLDAGRHPDEGWDCFGLVRWVLAHDRNPPIVLPSMVERYAAAYDHRQIQNMVHGEVAIMGGTEIPVGAERPMDVVVFRGVPFHCGIVLQFGQMLSVYRGAGTSIARYYDSAWRHRLIGFWRGDE